MKAVSDRRRRRDAVYSQRRAEVWERADGLCEVGVAADCARRCGQVHHRAGRGGPDPHQLDNLLCVCLPCHMWIESNRTAAYEAGWLIRRNS